MTDFHCEGITLDDYRYYLLNKHYARRIPVVTHAYGAYVGNVLYGVCTFGIPASHSLCIGICGEKYCNFVLELNRLCVDDNHPFETSKFVGKCLNYLGQVFRKSGRIVVSYADTGMNHVGKIYQATNFIYTGKTKERTDIFSGKHSRHYEKRRDCVYEQRQVRTAKHRYVYFVGSASFKKEARANLKYQVLPYPKGDTSRYDASAKINKQDLLFI